MFKKTIAKPADVFGIGLHTGVGVSMRLAPAASGGIVFYRTDKNVKIPLKVENVVGTKLATIIGKDGVAVSTIEHLLSAIMAYGIDNLVIEIDNEEIPTLDGSSAGFCMMLDEAGVLEQKTKKKILVVKKAVEVSDEQKFVRLEPSRKTVFDFKINFDHPMIKEQAFSFEFTTQNYVREISRARTFGFLHELNYLKSIGKGKGATLNNVIGLDEKKVLNNEGLRFKDEFVRHKILDAIGDMSFINMPFVARYSSFAGSHHLNHLLVKKLLADKTAYEIVEAK